MNQNPMISTQDIRNAPYKDAVKVLIPLLEAADRMAPWSEPMEVLSIMNTNRDLTEAATLGGARRSEFHATSEYALYRVATLAEAEAIDENVRAIVEVIAGGDEETRYTVHRLPL